MSVAADPLPIEVTVRGNVGNFAGDYARDKIAAALEVAHEPVLHGHVVLDFSHDPALERLALAKVAVDVNGTTIRAKTSAPTMNEAEDDAEPFVFYLNNQTGEGRVLYHRYDGHFGLITLTT